MLTQGCCPLDALDASPIGAATSDGAAIVTGFSTLRLAAAVCVIAVSGCAQRAPAPPPSRGGPATFVGRAGDDAMFVQWTDDGAHRLSGSIQIVRSATASSASTQAPLDSQTLSFDGTVNGSQISLVINQGLGSTVTSLGTLASDVLTLNLAGVAGGVVPVRLHRGDVGEYNRLVAVLTYDVEQARQTAAAAAAAASASARVEADLTAASDAVEQDVNTINQMLATKVDFARVDRDITQAGVDLADTLSKVAAVKTAGDQACTASSDTMYAASAVGYDASSLDYDAAVVQQAIDGLRGAVTKLEEHHQAFLHLQAAGPGDDAVVTALKKRGTAQAAAWARRLDEARSKMTKMAARAAAASVSVEGTCSG
jgi:hypothetical protein